jgi:hypothetical protein
LWKSALSWFSVRQSLCYFACREHFKYDQTAWSWVSRICDIYYCLSICSNSGKHESLCKFLVSRRECSLYLRYSVFFLKWELMPKNVWKSRLDNQAYVSLFKISQSLRSCDGLWIFWWGTDKFYWLFCVQR